MNNKKSITGNKYLGLAISTFPEKFKEFDFSEPALMWYPDVLHIARMNELERTSSNLADWILGNLESCQRNFVKDLFCEDFEPMFDPIFKSNIEKYFTDKSRDEIITSVGNIVRRLDGSTCVQLINYEWSVAIIE